MKASVFSLSGKPLKEITLPKQFEEKIRPDIIKRAVLSQQSHSIQPQGTDLLSGLRKVHWLTKRRNRYKSTYGRGKSRTPSKTMVRRGRHFTFVGAFAPQTRGGRPAHPPMAEKDIGKNINTKERKLAIRSAIAATADPEIVRARGHRYDGKVPIIISKEVEKMDKTKEVEKLLMKLNMAKELERVKKKKVRAGKGKMRGRKYKKKVGPLFVVGGKCELLKSVGAMPGTEAIIAKDLNAEVLAPGTYPGRLTIWSEEAIEELKKGLFT
jgi:large subunit ribosomal protein L4e